MLGIGFPIHFRNAPDLVYKLIDKMRGKGRPVFFFVTKGLYSGDALKKIIEYSATKNFRHVGSVELFMPGTDFLILFAKKGSLTERFLKHIHSRDIAGKINELTRNILNPRPVRAPLSKWYVALDDYAVNKLEILYDNCHRDYIGQFLSNPNTCIECFKCVTGCPKNNITFDGVIKFGSDCDVCFYCIHNCPTDSIQIAKITEGKVRYNKVDLR